MFGENLPPGVHSGMIAVKLDVGFAADVEAHVVKKHENSQLIYELYWGEQGFALPSVERARFLKSMTDALRFWTSAALLPRSGGNGDPDGCGKRSGLIIGEVPAKRHCLGRGRIASHYRMIRTVCRSQTHRPFGEKRQVVLAFYCTGLNTSQKFHQVTTRLLRASGRGWGLCSGALLDEEWRASLSNTFSGPTGRSAAIAIDEIRKAR